MSGLIRHLILFFLDEFFVGGRPLEVEDTPNILDVGLALSRVTRSLLLGCLQITRTPYAAHGASFRAKIFKAVSMEISYGFSIVADATSVFLPRSLTS